ncbi:hypothetical protein TNCV_3703171 [Trichonephila clavipes]|nr:hypothetical protein TNCV_3703171 [Trichonephila clavipes]
MTTKPHPKTVRTQATIKKVKSLILKENTQTQKFITSELGIPSGTVSKIIHNDFKLKKLFNSKVDLLLQQHIGERKTNCRKLYEKHLAAEKMEICGKTR